MMLGKHKPLFAENKPATLAAWLDIATHRLVPSAQTRVRAEIEAHFADAVRSKQTAGATEADSQAAALAELGNTKVAAKRFSREYLTNNDAAILAALIKKSTRSQIMGIVGLLVLFFWMSTATSFLLPRDDQHALEGFHAIIGFGILYALDVPGVYFGRVGRGIVAGIDPPSTSLIQLIRIHFIANLILGIFCLGLSWSISQLDSDALFNWPIFAVFLFSGYKLFRLHKKLQLLGQNGSQRFPMASPLRD
jgi:hypothetical protein